MPDTVARTGTSAPAGRASSPAGRASLPAARRPGQPPAVPPVAYAGPVGPGPAWVALRRSGDLLAEAATAGDRAHRFGLCRLAAMNAAWAVCSAAVDERARARAATPWVLLAQARPALSEWALVFGACERRWSALCRGGPQPSGREVDDLFREADGFRRVVVGVLGRTGPAGRTAGSLP